MNYIEVFSEITQIETIPVGSSVRDCGRLRKQYGPGKAEDGDLRGIDECGEDYLYPAEYFVRVDLPSITVRSIDRSFKRAAKETA